MYQIELERYWNNDKTLIEVPEDMLLEDFAAEIRNHMRLSEEDYIVRYHYFISGHDKQVYMEEDSIGSFVDMLWEGGDDDNDPDKEAPQYQEKFYHAEEGVRVKDIFGEVGSLILYDQSDDKVYGELKAIVEVDPKEVLAEEIERKFEQKK